MKNCTLSSGDLVMRMQLQDKNSVALGSLIENLTAESLEVDVFPKTAGTLNTVEYNDSPKILFEGQKIYLYWGDDAAKSGTCYYYLNVLRFKMSHYMTDVLGAGG